VTADNPDRTASFTRFYRVNYLDIREFASWRCLPDEVDDVVADAFTVAWRRFDSLDDLWARQWLFGVVKNVIRARRRSANRADRLQRQIGTERPVLTVDLYAGDMPLEDVDLLRAAMRSLSEDDQEIVLLNSWFEMEPADLAQVLCCSGNAAAVRLHRARARLRRATLRIAGDES